MLDLNKLEEICNAATPGPWCIGLSGTPFGGSWFDDIHVSETYKKIAKVTGNPADGELVAKSRTVIPELIAEVRRLQSLFDPADKRGDSFIGKAFAATVKSTHWENTAKVLASALRDGASECPYLTFWADGADLEIPDWCECTDTDEYGFECTCDDARGCWLKWGEAKVKEAENGK